MAAGPQELEDAAVIRCFFVAAYVVCCATAIAGARVPEAEACFALTFYALLWVAAAAGSTTTGGASV